MRHLLSNAKQTVYTNVYPFPHKIHDSSKNTKRRKLKFLDNYQEVSSNLFSFYFKDTSHDLKCTTLLDIQNIFDSEKVCSLNGSLVSMLVCDFPALDTRLLYEKVAGEASLKNAITKQFHLYLLKSLLLFCKERGVQGIVLTFNEGCHSPLEDYRRFVATEAVVTTEKGKEIQVIIPTDDDIYTELVSFIDETEIDFRQTLWRDQKENIPIRTYLKSHALFFCI
ncbi:MAG: hypothetical protein FJX71_02860 [Alphaproteobacteria bacterium]|nr:hypothetical protein [Alphaproteobacteria bacterium]